MPSSPSGPSSDPPSPPHGVAPPGFRLPPSTHLGPVRLQVADLDRSLDWYARVLGLHATARGDGRASLAAQDGTTLVVLVGRPGATPVPRSGRIGLFHYALLLPERAALGAFLDHLGRVGQPIGASDHLVSEAIYLSDPDGLGIEVYADRPRDSWRVHEGEIAMGTRALDAADLIRAADGASWEGMPAGTTMGHMHLSVGDLREADAFYHQRLGFDRVVWSYPGALFLSVGGYHHHLGLNTWAAGGPAADGDARLLEWEIVVPARDDLGALAEHLEEGDVAFTREALGLRLSDAWGTTVRVAAPDGR